MKKLFLSLVSAIFVATGFAQEVDFKIQLENGKPLKASLLNKMDVDGAQSMLMDASLGLTILPSNQEKENFNIDYTLNTVKVDIDAGMMTISYDSESEVTDDAAKALESEFSKAIGKTIKAILTNKGEIISLEGIEDLGEGLDKETLQNISASLPSTPKKVGDSWENPEVQNNQFGTIKSTSTFKEITADGYIIDVKGIVSAPSGEEIGEVSGNYTLDKKTHFTKNATLKTTFEIQGTKVISDLIITIN